MTMADSKLTDCAIFKGVLKSYLPGEQLTVKYELQADYKPASRDWVGLFQVGWTSSRDYYTFEWAPLPNDNKGMVQFAGRRLPPEDTHFYQFCYVSSNGRVRGASPPFQFTSASLKHNIEDLELVEVNEDSIMVLQPKSSQETQPQTSVAEESFSVISSVVEKEALSEQMAAIETERKQQTEALREKEATIAKLQEEMQGSEKRATEKLEALRREYHELLALKNSNDSQLALFTSQLAGKEDDIAQLNTSVMTQNAEIRELRNQLAVRDNQVENLTRLATARGEEKEQLSAEMERVTEELLVNKGRMAELIEINDQKTIEIEQLQCNVEEARKELETHAKACNDLQQELNIARENISELMGQGQIEGGVVFERPTGTLPEPPTAPAAPAGTVDSAVYASLLEAFENVQKYYEEATKKNIALQSKKDELIARVDQCRMRYEDVAKENYELKKRARTDKAKIRELEEQVEDVSQGCGTAVTELSSRKEELAAKDAKITELEDVLRQVQAELTSFQDRYDIEMQRRTEAVDVQKAALDSKLGELNVAQGEIQRLKHANSQLKAQLESLKQTAQPADRTCPVCSTKFPARMAQQDFENHVQGHFGNRY